MGGSPERGTWTGLLGQREMVSGFGWTPEAQRGGVRSRGATLSGLPPHRAPRFSVRVPGAPARPPPAPRAGGRRCPGAGGARGRRRAPRREARLHARASGARHEGAGKPSSSRPGMTAPAAGSGWLGGCSRERRGGAGRRGFGGRGEAGGPGPGREGSGGGGQAGDAGKPLPPVAESQPLTSGVFLKVNNKPRGGGENRAAAAAPGGRKEGAGRRRRGPPTPGEARPGEEAAAPRPVPGASRGPAPPPASRLPPPAAASPAWPGPRPSGVFWG